MAENEKLSRTMRIDLIPEVPAEPVKGKKKRVVLAPPTRKLRRAAMPTTAATQVSDYEQLLQSLYDAAIIADLDGKIIDVNPRAEEFLQYTRDELKVLTISEVVSGADASLIGQLQGNLETSRFALIQAYCVRKDRSFFPSEIAVNKLSIQGTQLCFFLRDITVRKQAEEMLMTEHNAIQNAGNGIAIVDLESRLEYINPSVLEMWGYAEADEVLTYDVRALFLDQGAANNMIAAVMGDEHAWTADMVAVRKDSSQFDVQVSASCNRNADGEPIGIVFSFADISDRRRAAEAEKEAERRRVMLESLGAACHHLGQPATVLLANLGIIQKRLDGADDLVRELVKTSIEAAESLGAILHKLNTVNEYKTTQYLERREGSDTEENRILDI